MDKINPNQIIPTFLQRGVEKIRVKTQPECDEAYFNQGFHEVGKPETAFTKPKKEIIDDTEKEALKDLAEEMGIKVDGRWSKERIQEEIDQKMSEIEEDSETFTEE